MKYCADVMNHTSEKSLGGRPPLSVLLGVTIDISIILQFVFWDIVYVSRDQDSSFNRQVGHEATNEIRCRFVGFAWNVGHALTFRVFNEKTRKFLERSQLRLGTEGENNIRLDSTTSGTTDRVFVTSKRGDDEILPTIYPSPDPFDIEYDGNEEEPDEEPNLDELLENVNKPDGTKPLEDAPLPPKKGSKSDQQKKKPTEPTRRSTRIRKQVDMTANNNEVGTNLGEEDESYVSPFDSPPLSRRPIVEDVPEEDELIAEHVKDKRAPGAPNPKSEPLKFDENFESVNPTEKGLPPEKVPGRYVLLPPDEEGTRVRAKIIERIDDYKNGIDQSHPELIKFRCLVNDKYEDILAYTDIVDYIEKDQTWDGIWAFRNILGHQGPLRSTDKNYKGSKYNVRIEWEDGTTTWEPLEQMIKADGVTVAIYARKNNLLNTPGWKSPKLRRLAKTEQRMIRRANQAKLHSFRTKPVYMYGYLVPRNHAQAVEIDERNGNTLWQDSEKLELGQHEEYDTFIKKGKGYRPGPEYKRINVHMVYAVKHDGRHKARLVAGGHLTDTPIDSVYSSVVSLRGIRLVTFIAELNDLALWATDIGNAYLESVTQEKVYIVAGPEFGELEGHTLIIHKALYGLKSSGLRWHERFADVLREMGFFPSKAERDIWMRHMGDHYEYIAVYVDDLLIASRNPAEIVSKLLDVYKFKLKGTGPVSFHLGCDFFRDDEGNLCYAPKKYIDKMLENYRRIYGTMPKKAHSPLVKNDHPELDATDLLDIEETKVYQSLIGALQWVIQIGRWDVATAVMSLSRFRAAPRKGHLERVKRVHGYLLKMKNGVIRIRTDMPDYSDIPDKVYDWESTCYAGAKEEVPKDCPPPLGKEVQMTSFVDANLYHCLVSGRSVTGILHMWNKTPIDHYSKLQATVETATFGSEYVATRTCVEQIIDLRMTARYLGVPIKGSSMMFGDNESVVNTASIPHSKLSKRHNALSYHKTRESIAAKIVKYFHVAGKKNPADILSKHWDMPSVWDTLRPLMFWYGDTGSIPKDPVTNNNQK